MSDSDPDSDEAAALADAARTADADSSSEPWAILKRFLQAAGIPFDPTAVQRAIRQAEREVPSTASRAAQARLLSAAEALGLQIRYCLLSTTEALEASAAKGPLAVFSVSSAGTARWRLLTGARRGRGTLASLGPDEVEERLDADGIARKIGAADRHAVVEWMAAEAAAPLAEASAHGSAGSEDDHGHHGPPPFQRLLALLRPERSELWMVVVYALGVGVLSLAVPITAMAVVNTTAMATLLQQLVVLCLTLFACLGLAALLRALQAVVVEFLQQRLFVRVVADLSHRLPRVDVRAFDQQHGPELVNRFFDVLTVQKACAGLLLDGVTVVLQAAIGFTLLAFYHQILLGFDLVLIAALAFMVFVLGRGAVGSAIQESKAKYVVAGWVEELARHPAAFKLAGGPQFARERADELARDYLLARQSHFRILMRQYAFALGLQAVASAALLGLGGWLVIEGQLTLGQLVASEIVVAAVVASFTKLVKQMESFYDLLAAVDKLGHLTDLPLERAGGGVPQPRSRGASLRVRNLSFSYAGGRRKALEDLSFDLAPGERAAVVGPNGAGKSTLVDLLFGLRNPSKGRIEIDGEDVRDLRLESLREHAAVVRGVEVFEGSLVDNVRMGRQSLSTADVRRALEAVGLLEAVLELPQGLKTPLRAGGAPLSLGQAERLMIARAIVGSPRLLVLDEALDEMDQEVRGAVLPALLGPEARWTLLVVTHSREVAAMCGRQIRLERSGPARGVGPQTEAAAEDVRGTPSGTPS